jgi:hypothetical protein
MLALGIAAKLIKLGDLASYFINAMPHPESVNQFNIHPVLPIFDLLCLADARYIAREDFMRVVIQCPQLHLRRIMPEHPRDFKRVIQDVGCWMLTAKPADPLHGFSEPSRAGDARTDPIFYV